MRRSVAARSSVSSSSIRPCRSAVSRRPMRLFSRSHLIEAMARALVDIVREYQRDLPLSEASTIPSDWYTDARVLDLEQRTVFSRAWLVAGRVDQLARP